MIFYQNVRGLRTRVNDVYLSSVQSEYDIIALTETWLHPAINSGELFDETYNVYRKDRNNSLRTRGGGVLLAVEKRLSTERVNELETEDAYCESVWIKLNNYRSRRKPLYIGLFYFPPDAPIKTYRTANDNIIRLAASGADIIILGDFNIPSFNHQKYTEIEAVSDKRLLELFDLFQIANLLSFNTVVNHQGKTLDLILGNVLGIVVTPGDSLVRHVDKYHPPLQVNVHNIKIGNKMNENKERRAEVRRSISQPLNVQRKLNYAKADFYALYRKIEKINWEPLYSIDKPDRAAEHVQKEIYKVIIETVPEKKTRGNHKYPIWFTREIISTIRAKERVRKRLKKVNHPDLRLKYHTLRANSKKAIRNAYKQYVRDTECQIATNPQYFWKHINSKRESKIDANVMQYGNRTYTDSSDIASAFAEYFATVYGEKKFEGDVFQYIKQSNSETSNIPTVSLQHFTSEDINMSFSKLKPKRGLGPDGIPPYIYKGCKEFLIPPLTYVCNLILQTNVYPRSWVISKITPVPKSESIQEITNHRPISTIPVPAKIFESAIFEKLYHQTRTSVPFQQHGFVRDRSILTNVMELVHRVGQTLDRSSQTDIIYTDFSKAFDRVDHYKLLLKLNNLGFSDNLLRLVESYLMKRQQYVVYKGVRSNLFDSPSGVPQGSNLGPYLFLLYVSDIHAKLNSNSLLYADDMKIYREIKNMNDANMLQNDLNMLVEWGEENQLSLNIKKCDFIRVTRKTNPIETSYNIKGEKLQRVEHIRDLGVQIEHNLVFNKQLQNSVSNAKRNLGMIMRHSKIFSNASTLKILYFSLVRTHLDFAGVIWGPTASSHIKTIERIQKRFLRYLYFKDFQYYDLETPYRELVLGYELTTLEVRREASLILFIRDLLMSKIESPFLLSQIGLHAPVRHGRNQNLFNIAHCRTAHFNLTPLNRALRLYNQIIEIDSTIDLFFDKRNTFADKITRALDIVHSGTG